MNHRPFKIYLGPLAEAVVYDAMFCKASEVSRSLDRAGIYVIYDCARVIYVGETDHLGRRIADHPILKEMAEASTDCALHLLFIADPIERKTVEACLVGLLKPPRNRMQRARIC